ncbi:hypothetical protein LPJ78_004494 [Coemansia sp. RSA 989]|nr:hypothetical protein LPJ68_004051 [Coemansia sp. RSA 1086]KAJ1750833.1 hypothetical protein LPJ79_002597 [Coemansia sp. RSA 1821]KAJ1862763.1 hypothetical protein LPJ78_004494 [Coemansia sp. RSA 989]KAJ1872750.1 hypothetical protein LPJ55_002834 [Coemansia sp. RSA 990]KAJ2632082.1 hypothetical protein H4R22_001516 [Coemansia sp. RSA 1290]KAJ2648112.1 hypothetical protein IWW40_004200 [Coemansia sp. RSA 1250]KAJ2669618.1 hypothetical protein IWW42_004476 [Coemansia sp. RSA 1085]
MHAHAPRWRPFSNPDPLGNSGFAVSTFVSALHTGAIGISSGAPPNIVVGLALFYGGMAQVIAGGWSFAINNSFGAVVFTSYGCFWLSYAATLIPSFGISQVLSSLDAETRAHSLGIFYLAWVLQTFIFLLGSSRRTWGSFLTLLFLLITNTLTCAGNWIQSEHVLHAGGYMGMITAIIAWYTVAADMLTTETFYCRLPNPAMGLHSMSDGIDTAVNTPFAPALCSPQITSKLHGRTPECHIDLVHPMDSQPPRHRRGDKRRSRTSSSSSHIFGISTCNVGHGSPAQV